ncbi:MAG: hypothetical protein RLN72_16110 [Henriciella sp.]
MTKKDIEVPPLQARLRSLPVPDGSEELVNAFEALLSDQVQLAGDARGRLEAERADAGEGNEGG